MPFAELTRKLNKASLMTASIGGHIYLLDRLINEGVDVSSAVGANGLTPLMVSLREGKLNYARRLIDHEVDPTRTDSNGNTALYYAQALADSTQDSHAVEMVAFLEAYQQDYRLSKAIVCKDEMDGFIF